MVDGNDDRALARCRMELAAARRRIAALELAAAAGQRRERVLQQAVDELRTVMTHVPDPIFVTDDKGAFVFICDNVLYALGYTVAEIKAMGTISALLGEDLFDLQILATQGEIENIERVIVDWAGRSRTFLVDVRRVAIDGGTMLYVCRDISGRKAAELALRRYRRIVSVTPDSISLVDTTYTYRVVNRAYLARTGRTYDEIVGHTVVEVLGEDAFETLIKDRLDRCMAGETIRYQAWFDFKGAGRRFMDVTYSPYQEMDDTVVGALVSARDVTDVKLAQQALMASQARFSRLVETIKEVYWIRDVASDRITYLSPGYEKIWGRPVADYKSGDFIASVHPEDRDGVREAYRQSNGQSFEREYRIIRSDGVVRWVWVRLFNDDASGEQGHQVGVALDITERKAAEARIRQALAEKETLLRELYHRTKNNMQVISSMLGLEAFQIDDPAVQTVFSEIQSRIHSMALVHQMLYQSQDLSRINVGDYLRLLSNALLDSYGVPVGRVMLALDVDDVWMSIDAAIPCGLIVNELVSNALKYAFPGDRAGTVELSLTRLPDGDIVLGVCDDGVGVPEGFDLRRCDTLGMLTILSLAEHQLRGRLTFDTAAGVACEVRFRDDLYEPRV